MDFYVGQRVVCIARSWGPTWADWTFPVLNGIYTVRNLGTGSPAQQQWWGAKPAIHLLEIRNHEDISGEEPYFGVCGFRPLEERKTDISIFTKMLQPDKVNA